MQIANVDDYYEMARRKLPSFLFDYIGGGSYSEGTFRRNTADFERVLLRQRVLCDVSEIDTSTKLFGQRVSMPLALAPVGLAGMSARRGEVQAIRAATEAGIPFSLSALSVCSIAEVSAASAVAPWLQLYMTKDRAFMEAFLALGQTQNARVLLFTVDLPVPATRYRDVRSGLARSPDPGIWMRRFWDSLRHPAWAWDVGVRGQPHALGNVAPSMARGATFDAFWSWVGRNFDASVTWDDISWVRERWKGPIVLKGLLDPEDARRAVEIGVDGIIVSNHGGRQLDGTSSAIAALLAIVDAIEGRTTILLDGGVRSGLDILRALALGAQGVLIGRPWILALASRGQAGVAHVLEILRAELRVAMALTGCTRLSDVGRHIISDLAH
jgi:L-lactate dehydrogenase (cytochrome)